MTDPTPTLLQRLRVKLDNSADLASCLGHEEAEGAPRAEVVSIAENSLAHMASIARAALCEAEILRQELDVITGAPIGEFQSKAEEDLWARIVGDLAGENGADCAAMIADRAVVLYRARRSKVEGF